MENKLKYDPILFCSVEQNVFDVLRRDFHGPTLLLEAKISLNALYNANIVIVQGPTHFLVPQNRWANDIHAVIPNGLLESYINQFSNELSSVNQLGQSNPQPVPLANQLRSIACRAIIDRKILNGDGDVIYKAGNEIDALQALVSKLTKEVQSVRDERDGWESTAAQHIRNTQYYRDIVVRIGELLGADAYTCDDGTVVPDVLCAKVYELVAARLSNPAIGKCSELPATEPVVDRSNTQKQLLSTIEAMLDGDVSDAKYHLAKWIASRPTT